MFFATKSASKISELYGTTRKKMKFFASSIKIWIALKFQRCFKTVMTKNLNSSCSVTTVWISFLPQRKVNRKLHTYSVAYDWTINFFDTCNEISIVRNIQWMRFWLIQFVSRSRTSSPRGDWLFFHQVLHQKPQSCNKEQGRNIKSFDWSIKIMIVRNMPNVIQNCYV